MKSHLLVITRLLRLGEACIQFSPRGSTAHPGTESDTVSPKQPPDLKASGTQPVKKAVLVANCLTRADSDPHLWLPSEMTPSDVPSEPSPVPGVCSLGTVPSSLSGLAPPHWCTPSRHDGGAEGHSRAQPRANQGVWVL